MLACLGVVDGSSGASSAIRMITGGFEPVRPIASPQPHDPQTELFRMGPPAEELGQKRPVAGPVCSAQRISEMRLGHVRGRGGRLAIVPAGMRGDPPPLRVDTSVMDELVRCRGDGRLGCGSRC